jgi:16S rRNA (cytidine1402-2'-O)-methyltransferase
LADLAAVCGDRPAAVCRELTKLHEEILRGGLRELAAAAEAGAIDERGELVIVVGWRPDGVGHASQEQQTHALEAARAEVERRVAAGGARGTAAKAVSAETGIPRRQLYGSAAAAARGGGLRPPPE